MDWKIGVNTTKVQSGIRHKAMAGRVLSQLVVTYTVSGGRKDNPSLDDMVLEESQLSRRTFVH